MRWRRAGRLRASKIAPGRFGTVLLTVIDLRKLLGRLGGCRAPGCLPACVGGWPWRQLPAGAPLMP